MKKVIITGSGGMLGKEIVTAFLNSGDYLVYGFDLVASNHEDNSYKECLFDLTDLVLLKQYLDEVGPDIIIHTAAIVNLNTCETNFLIGDNLHVSVSRVLSKTKAKVVYISTDSVFNGYTGDYTESDWPDPLNNYAKSKYLGELSIAANNRDFIIIRTNIFGYNYPLKNSLAEWALRSLSEGEKLKGFNDIYFNAIYTSHLSLALKQLIEIDYKGLLNIASPEYITKYDFLLYLAKTAGFPENSITEASIAEVDINIERPFNTTLNIDKVKDIILVPSIYTGIECLVNNYKKESKDEKN